MPAVLVLFINDAIVGPCLELVRKVCDPKSTSRPHVTVRYVEKLEKNIPQFYYDKPISDIDFVEPGAFGLIEKTVQSNRTVFIKCASEALENLSHKPHYPDSVFHVTLYDGHSVEFAEDLLQMVKGFDWNFRVALPENTRLDSIEIKKRRKKAERTATTSVFSDKLKSLFEKITNKTLNEEYLASLSPESRLEIAREICAYLHLKTAHYPKRTNTQKLIHGVGLTAIVPQKKAQPERSYEQTQDSLFPEMNTKWTGNIHPLKVNKVGLYLTPPELARDIVEYSLSLLGTPLPEIHFGDPAVGTGVFFSALSQALQKEQIASAIGIELDEKRATATRERWCHRGLEVIQGDYLHMERLPPRSLILANPPYVRYQHIEPHYGQKLRERASINMEMKISGQAGLYVYFLLLSHEWMAPDAVAAWLIPTEFMETKYGEAIRHYLTYKVQLIRIHRFSAGDAQFENALVSSAIVVFRNRLPMEGRSVLLTLGGSLNKPELIESVTVNELRLEKRWSIPRKSPLLVPALGPRLGELFTVNRGIATGANNYFIMERAAAAKNGIPECALRPILPKSRTLKTDIVESEEDGYPSITPQLCLLDCYLKEEEIRSKYPQLMNFLETAEELGVTKSTLVKRRKPWYRQERREPPLYFCTYMGRGGQDVPPIRFIWNKSKAISTNAYLMLYPREKLADLLSSRPEFQAEIYTLLQEVALRGLSEHGRVYGGGLRKIEPRELLDVRMLTFPKWLEEVIDRQLF